MQTSLDSIRIRLDSKNKLEYAAHYEEDVRLLVSIIKDMSKDDRIIELEDALDKVIKTDAGRCHKFQDELKELLLKYQEFIPFNGPVA